MFTCAIIISRRMPEVNWRMNMLIQVYDMVDHSLRKFRVACRFPEGRLDSLVLFSVYSCGKTQIAIMAQKVVLLRRSSARGEAGALLLLLGFLAISRLSCVSAQVVIHRSGFSEVSDKSLLEVVACTPHGTTVTFTIREFGQVRSERSTLTPGESASLEIAQGNMNDWTCSARFELLNSTTRYFKEFPLWGPHGPKCSCCRWIFKDYQSGIFLDSHDGRGPVHVLDWDVDVDTDKQFSSGGD